MDRNISLLQAAGVPVVFEAQVDPAQCDELGHMNVQHYVAAVSQGVFSLLASAGLDRRTSVELGVHVAGARMEIDYLRECWPGERIELRSAVTAVRTSSVTFVHELFAGPDVALAMRCVVTGVCIGLRERRSTPLPPQVRDRLARLQIMVPLAHPDLDLRLR